MMRGNQFRALARRAKYRAEHQYRHPNTATIAIPVSKLESDLSVAAATAGRRFVTSKTTSAAVPATSPKAAQHVRFF